VEASWRGCELSEQTHAPCSNRGASAGASAGAKGENERGETECLGSVSETEECVRWVVRRGLEKSWAMGGQGEFGSELAGTGGRRRREKAINVGMERSVGC
jgi:hypothetical protein